MNIRIVLALAVCFTASACDKGPNPNNVKGDAFSALLNSSGGDTYAAVKTTTQVSGYMVFQDRTTGEYVAYNLTNFNAARMTTLGQYTAVASPSDVVRGLTQVTTQVWQPDSYGNGSITEGSYVPVITYTNGTYTFETKRASSKDLEKVIASASQVDTHTIQTALVAEYGFSADRAVKVATLTKQMQEIAGSRTLTDTDKNSFVQEALGSDFQTLQNSMQNADAGNSAQYDRLVEAAAATNGTTPEQTRQLISDMMGSAQ